MHARGAGLPARAGVTARTRRRIVRETTLGRRLPWCVRASQQNTIKDALLPLILAISSGKTEGQVEGESGCFGSDCRPAGCGRALRKGGGGSECAASQSEELPRCAREIEHDAWKLRRRKMPCLVALAPWGRVGGAWQEGLGGTGRKHVATCAHTNVELHRDAHRGSTSKRRDTPRYGSSSRAPQRSL
jgi:hypothetical protein